MTDPRESQPVASLAKVLRLDEDSAQKIPDIKTLEGSDEPMETTTSEGFLDVVTTMTSPGTFSESDQQQTAAKAIHSKRRRTDDDDASESGRSMTLSSESSDFDLLSVRLTIPVLL